MTTLDPICPHPYAHQVSSRRRHVTVKRFNVLCRLSEQDIINTVPEDVEDAATRPPVTIDHDVYPHIIASILSYAKAGVLSVFGATSKYYRDYVEDLLAPSQTVAYVSFNCVKGRPNSGLPTMKGNEEAIAAFLAADVPRLRNRLRRVRALEFPTCLKTFRGKHWHAVPLISQETYRTLFPSVIVRMRNHADIPERLVRVMDKMAIFLDLELGLPECAKRSRLHVPRKRMVVNVRGSSGAHVSPLLTVLPKLSYPPCLVLNFDAWEVPHGTVKYMTLVESTMLITYIAEALKRCTVVLVEFGRVWAWSQPPDDTDDESQLVPLDYRTVETLLAPFRLPAKKKLHVLSLAEYRQSAGDGFAAETYWSI
ncbi:hypothetical protein CC85DRAFT_147852 [Cutaneotrichosporon oleaginosum]|uniref:Uncharacterized protein n=1 Tax=Cutaneotrichosporon oleaginosum TaxID=879819 RepID=A0A0J1AYV9_9TREE|nr:uncharacterized protein CC85DRAFT_147852 [Cutaneotrichosporon oleaginosum]KLT40509.1 hypothetical protein CC85DRAFT_147852 [Cutaneotrichosporon oleaginosum]TXT08419.1 hypothetical protein COLE_05343 [Cutaneotrichosporon oleaginosum]